MKKIQKALFWCGIISSLLYIFTDILAVMHWKGYSYTSQTFSELIASGAPTRPLVVPLSMIYGLLILSFGIGVWRSAGQKRVLRVAAALIVAKEIIGVLVTLFAPIHMRGVAGNLSDTMHAVFTAVGVLLCMFPAMGFAAAAFGKRFRVYSSVTMAVFLVCGVLAGMNGPKIAANLPTPGTGVLERINIYGYMLWIVVFAIILLQKENAVNNGTVPREMKSCR